MDGYNNTTHTSSSHLSDVYRLYIVLDIFTLGLYGCCMTYTNQLTINHIHQLVPFFYTGPQGLHKFSLENIYIYQYLQ